MRHKMCRVVAAFNDMRIRVVSTVGVDGGSPLTDVFNGRKKRESGSPIHCGRV